MFGTMHIVRSASFPWAVFNFMLRIVQVKYMFIFVTRFALFAVSPPLPPPPEDDHSLFMANYTPPSPPSYPNQSGDGANTWIPTTYLEKGRNY